MMFQLLGWFFFCTATQQKSQTYSGVIISFGDSFEGGLRNQTLELQMEFLVRQVVKNRVRRRWRQPTFEEIGSRNIKTRCDKNTVNGLFVLVRPRWKLTACRVLGSSLYSSSNSLIEPAMMPRIYIFGTPEWCRTLIYSMVHCKLLPDIQDNNLIYWTRSITWICTMQKSKILWFFCSKIISEFWYPKSCEYFLLNLSTSMAKEIYF